MHRVKLVSKANLVSYQSGLRSIGCMLYAMLLVLFILLLHIPILCSNICMALRRKIEYLDIFDTWTLISAITVRVRVQVT